MLVTSMKYTIVSPTLTTVLSAVLRMSSSARLGWLMKSLSVNVGTGDDRERAVLVVGSRLHAEVGQVLDLGDGVGTVGQSR